MNVSHCPGWSRSLGILLARMRERNESNSGWTFLSCKNWVREGNDSDFSRAIGTMRIS